MDKEKVEKLLKKHNIVIGNRTAEQLIEIVEITCDGLLDRYNRKKDEELQDQISDLQDVISYLEKNKSYMVELLVESDEEEKKTSEQEIDTESLKKSSKKTGAKSISNVGNQPSSGSNGTLGTPATATPGNKRHLWFVSNNGDTNIDNLFILAEDALKYGEWDKAERMFASIQGMENDNPGSYIGKVLAKYHKSTPAELASDNKIPLDSDFNMSSAYQYSNDKQKKYLDDLMKEWQNAKVYTEALVLAGKGDQYSLRKAAELMESISSYRDASTKAAEYRTKCNDLLNADNRKRQIDDANRQAQILLDKFRSATDNKSKKELAEKIIDLRKNFPDTNGILTYTIMKNEIESFDASDSKKKDQKNNKRNKSVSKGRRRTNPIAMLLLICALFIGASVYFIFKVISGDIVLPESLANNMGTATVGSGKYIYNGQGRELDDVVSIPEGTKYVSISHSSNLKKLILNTDVEILSIYDCPSLRAIETQGYKVADFAVENCDSLYVMQAIVTNSLHVIGTGLSGDTIQKICGESLAYINIDNGGITSFDASELPDLKYIYIRSSNLRHLKTDISALDTLEVSVGNNGKHLLMNKNDRSETAGRRYWYNNEKYGQDFYEQIEIDDIAQLESIEFADGKLSFESPEDGKKVLALPEGVVRFSFRNSWKEITDLQIPGSLEELNIQNNAGITSLSTPAGNLKTISLYMCDINELDVSASEDLSLLSINNCFLLRNIKTFMEVDECYYNYDPIQTNFVCEISEQKEERIKIYNDNNLGFDSIGTKHGAIEFISIVNPEKFVFPEGIKKVTIKNFVLENEIVLPESIEVVNLSGCDNITKYNMPESLLYFHINGETLIEK